MRKHTFSRDRSKLRDREWEEKQKKSGSLLKATNNIKNEKRWIGWNEKGKPGPVETYTLDELEERKKSDKDKNNT